MTHTLFIAGTDTDVGKTVVSKAILQAADKMGMTTIGFKPVAAGCEVTAVHVDHGQRNGSDAEVERVRSYAGSIGAAFEAAEAEGQGVAVVDGRIVENGTHDALLAEGGLYAGFWQRQSGGFLDTSQAAE